jgi:hypothetical protein
VHTPRHRSRPLNGSLTARTAVRPRGWAASPLTHPWGRDRNRPLLTPTIAHMSGNRLEDVAVQVLVDGAWLDGWLDTCSGAMAAGTGSSGTRQRRPRPI